MDANFMARLADLRNEQMRALQESRDDARKVIADADIALQAKIARHEVAKQKLTNLMDIMKAMDVDKYVMKESGKLVTMRIAPWDPHTSTLEIFLQHYGYRFISIFYNSDDQFSFGKGWMDALGCLKTTAGKHMYAGKADDEVVAVNMLLALLTPLCDPLKSILD